MVNIFPIRYHKLKQNTLLRCSGALSTENAEFVEKEFEVIKSNKLLAKSSHMANLGTSNIEFAHAYFQFKV